jgi:hypothetical protein
MADTTDPVIRQKVEVLDGSRSSAGKRGQAAVRLDDLAELLRLPDKLNAIKVTGAPTMSDFNALVDDVQGILRALLGSNSALRARLGR